MLAPLAFISYTLPPLRSYWDMWWKELLSKSFCITVFMFLIWLTLIIVRGSFYNNMFTNSDLSFTKIIIMTVLKFTIVIKLFDIALSETKKMCGDGGIGDKIFGIVKTVLSFAVGALTGGAAVAVGASMRRVVGGFAEKKAKEVEESGGGTTRWGKLKLQTLKKVGNAKFGTEEGYRERTKRVADERKSYMESLPKEAIDSQGRKIKPREQFHANMARSSVVSWMMGNRPGEKKFVEDINKKTTMKAKKEKLKKDLLLSSEYEEIKKTKLDIQAAQANLESLQSRDKNDNVRGTLLQIESQRKSVLNLGERMKQLQEKFDEIKEKKLKEIEDK